MSLSFVNLIRIDFSEPLLLADFGHDIEFQGETYRANTPLLVDIGDVTEENQINTTTFDITLAAIDELVALVRTGYWLNLPIYYYRIWYEDGVQTDVDIVFRGRLTEQDETDGESTKTIKFSCSNHFLDWESTGGRTATNASQTIFDADDKGLEHAGKEKSNVKWGQ